MFLEVCCHCCNYPGHSLLKNCSPDIVYKLLKPGCVGVQCVVKEQQSFKIYCWPSISFKTVRIFTVMESKGTGRE